MEPALLALPDHRIPVDPVIEAYQKDVDRTLIRESLRLTVQQRFERLMDLQRFAEELGWAGRRARSGS
jgi:hypothetical protein